MFSANEANRQYFRDAYRTGEHGWAVHEPSPYAVDFLHQLSSVTPNGAMLDVGCGEGRHSIAAARTGFRVVGIDYEPLALRRARSFAKAHGIKGITFRVADVLDMSFGDACFDVVLDYGCLHHQRKTDWPRYKAGILRVLKSRGYYVLSVFSPRFRFSEAPPGTGISHTALTGGASQEKTSATCSPPISQSSGWLRRRATAAASGML